MISSSLGAPACWIEKTTSVIGRTRGSGAESRFARGASEGRPSRTNTVTIELTDLRARQRPDYRDYSTTALRDYRSLCGANDSTHRHTHTATTHRPLSTLFANPGILPPQFFKPG